MITFEDYARHDAVGLAELVRRREVSPLELVEAAIARIEAVDPRINAIVRRRYEAARAEAARVDPGAPLAGVPYLLKDLVATIAGEPTSQGTRLLVDKPMACDSELVRRQRAAGLLIIGRTNTPELGLTPHTEPALFGPTRNPWSPAHSPGGSSGGSAAAVAARIVPAASGGDGGGSIRIPASCCGLFGLKPSRGTTPTGPLHGELWRGYTIEHAITRSVRDSAALLDATAGADLGTPYAAPPRARPFCDELSRGPGRLRIAFTTKPLFGQRVHGDCVAGVHASAALLASLDHFVEEAAPRVDGEACAIAFVTVLAGETRAEIETVCRLVGRTPRAADFEPTSYSLGLLGRALSAAQYANAARTLQEAARATAPFFAHYDVLLTPTLATPPALLGALQPSASEFRLMRVVNAMNAGWLLRAMNVVAPLAARTFDYMPFTPLFNATGQPAMSVPLHWTDDGLPVGMQFVSAFGRDALLLRLAAQLEQARPWADRLPPHIG